MFRPALIKTLLPLVKTLLPLAGCLAGIGLLAGAWPLSDALVADKSFPIYFNLITAWIFAPLAFVILYAHERYPRSFNRRLLAVLILFICGVVPYMAAHVRTLAAQSMSVAGLMMLGAGLLHWPQARPLCSRIGGWLGAHRAIGHTAFIRIACATFLAFTLSISYFCYSLLPVYTDSMAQYVHAKFVASGHLYYQRGHPLREFFPVWLMVHEAKWYSQYPPMQQTLIGLMMMLKAPWLTNPLEGMITLACIYAITRRAYGDNTARLSSMLMLLSPFILLMSGEYMNHSAALMFGTLLFYTYTELQARLAKPYNTQTLCFWALAAGLSAGCAFLSRPLTAVGISMPFALHACWRLYKDFKTFRLPFAMMALAASICVLFQLWYNYQTTGHAMMFAYTHYHGNSLGSAMGFHKGSSPRTTLNKMHVDWFWLNVNLFEWSLPCCFFAMLACLRKPKHLVTKLAIGILVTQSAGNMFNQFASTVFGPRYMYEVSGALIVLSARGISEVPMLLAGLGVALPGAAARRGMVAVALASVFAGALINHVPRKLRDYSHFMDSHPDFYRSMLTQSDHPALVFLCRNEHPNWREKSDPAAKFRWISWSFPPDEDAPVIFAYDHGVAGNRKLMNYYPNRKAYVESGGKLIPVVTP